jgi:hypothetical protein
MSTLNSTVRMQQSSQSFSQEIHMIELRLVSRPSTSQHKPLTVQVANISDSCYLGTDTTVTKLAPLLQQPKSNPSATLVTLYLNAVMEVAHRRGEKDAVPPLNLLMGYLPTPPISSLLSPNSADSLRLWDARSFALDVDGYFYGYVRCLPICVLLSTYRIWLAAPVIRCCMSLAPLLPV